MSLLSFIKGFLKNKNRNYVLLAQMANAIIALISGKIIAVYILPEDFGAYSLQWAAYTFFSTLLISPFIQYIKTTSGELLPKIGSKPYLITIILSTFVTFNLFTVFLYFYYNIFNILLCVIFLSFFVFSTIYQVLANYLNTQNKLIKFSKLGVLKTVSGLVFIILFFVFKLSFLNHVQVLWVLQLIGVFVGCLFFISNYKIFKPRFKVSYNVFLKKYFRFALPLMFMAVWAWINNYFDRYAIEYYLSFNDVGTYNANYSVGSKFFLLLIPIFWTLVTPTIYGRENLMVKKKFMQKYALIYFILGVPILATIYYLKDIIGSLLLSQNYSEGFFIIFWIALAIFIFTLTQLYELIFYAQLKTKVILWGNIISAVSNIMLNIILIPKYGLMGAAIATCIGFTIYFGTIYYNFKKL